MNIKQKMNGMLLIVVQSKDDSDLDLKDAELDDPGVNP